MANQDDTARTIEHVVRAVNGAAERQEPFHHLQLTQIFPADIYSAILEAMPAKEDYRPMSGRAKYTRTGDGGTRTKIDLFPEYIRHLPESKKRVWQVIGRALRAAQVGEAFRRRLAPGLEKRLGPGRRSIEMYPVPVLTRDVPGYRIGIHPDTRWKGMTIQIYLPRDRSIEHVGTVFHRRTDERAYERALQMPFAPNTGYAFAVGKDTYHSVDAVGAEILTRDSILLTYFLDDTFAHILTNRARRLGNFVLNEIRSLRL